jgi:hypothetical protein
LQDYIMSVNATDDEAAGSDNQAAWDCVGACAHTESSTHKVADTGSKSSKRCQGPTQDDVMRVDSASYEAAWGDNQAPWDYVGT